MRSKAVLSIVNNKLSSFYQLILLFNFSCTDNSIFIFLYIFLKFFGISVITSNFVLKPDLEYAYNFGAMFPILKGTLTFYLPSISVCCYYIISLLLFLIDDILLLCYLLLYAHSKERKRKTIFTLYP